MSQGSQIIVTHFTLAFRSDVFLILISFYSSPFKVCFGLAEQTR